MRFPPLKGRWWFHLSYRLSVCRVGNGWPSGGECMLGGWRQNPVRLLNVTWCNQQKTQIYTPWHRDSGLGLRPIAMVSAPVVPGFGHVHCTREGNPNRWAQSNRAQIKGGPNKRAQPKTRTNGPGPVPALSMRSFGQLASALKLQGLCV